jgi:putative aldouronate transport system substrate-binding protein
MYWDSVDNSFARTRDLPFQILGLPRPRAREDSRLHLSINPSRRGGNEASIVSTTRHRDAALRFLNFGYTQEGYMIYNYGVEGVTYNMVNGVPVYTDLVMNNPLFSTENANYILRIHFGAKWRSPDLVANPSVVRNPDSVAFRQRWSDDQFEDGIYFLPPLSLTPQELTRRAEIMTNVNTYAAEMIMRFIIGTEPLANFDRYLAELNRLGLPEAIRITQTAYDRYMAK